MYHLDRSWCAYSAFIATLEHLNGIQPLSLKYGVACSSPSAATPAESHSPCQLLTGQWLLGVKKDCPLDTFVFLLALFEDFFTRAKKRH